jgi:hypothetical protein
VRLVRDDDPPPLSEVVPGRRLETPEGSCYLVRREYPVGHHYGGRPLEEARNVAGDTLAALARDDGLTDLSLDRACFIDTETTGLAGGTGTYVFMVGLGFFEGDVFAIDQYFMEDYDQEPALISALSERFTGFDAVVSFNGKAFDLPLLETRFILSRVRPPLRSKPHLDLLFTSRRLWGLRLESCRLVRLEEAILGEIRAGDIPGAEVPEHYFRYLRTRDPWEVRPIFEHNRQDVLSLLALAGKAASRYEAFLGGPPQEEEIDPLDLLGLARLYGSAGRPEPSARCYLACLEALPARDEPWVDRAGIECIRLLRRLGRAREAMSLSERLTDAHPPRLWPFIELAKDLEHRVRDYERALAVVDRALGLLAASSPMAEPSRAASPWPNAEGLTRALLWRRGRLDRKRRNASGLRS